MKNYNATLIYMVSIVTYIAGMIFLPNVSPGDKRVYIEQWDKWINVEIVGWLYIMLPVIAIPVKMLLNAIFGTGEHTGFTEKNYNPYSEAMAYRLMSEDPYKGFRISRGNTNSVRYLTEEECTLLEQAEMLDEATGRARDLFVFCRYTGMAYSDLRAFDFKNVQKQGGKYIIRDNRVKTNTPYYLELLPPALEVLKKYDYKLPVISNANYNRLLKYVALAAGIRSLTSHMARHTFATWALSRGVALEVVSKMLGHTNIQTTQIYAKVMGRDILKAFDKLK